MWRVRACTQVDAEWFEGYLQGMTEGAKGIFPSNFVSIIKEIGAQAPAAPQR